MPQADQNIPEESNEPARTGYSGLHDEDPPFPACMGGKQGPLASCQTVQAFVVAGRNWLEKFVVYVKDGHKGGALFTTGGRGAAAGIPRTADIPEAADIPRTGAMAIQFPAGSGDDPGAGGAAGRRTGGAEGGKKGLPRIQGGPAAVQAAEFQGEGAELRTAEPKGNGESQGAGPQVQYPVPRDQGEFQGREQAADAVQVPGEKVAQIGGKQGRPVEIRKRPFSPGAGEEPGKFQRVGG
jgi:hypothetical protein